jgi:hypothetical protein
MGKEKLGKTLVYLQASNPQKQSWMSSKNAPFFELIASITFLVPYNVSL